MPLSPLSWTSFPLPLPWGGERDSSDGRDSPSFVPIHSVDNVIASPSQQQELPQLAQLFCSVPVSMTVSLPVSVPTSVPVKSSIAIVSFTQLSLISKVSPLQLDQFHAELRHHPDKSAVTYVISGIQDGFRIGFDPSLVSLKSASSNMHSSSEHPSVIDSYLYSYLQNEVSFGRVAGPFPAPPFQSLHISRFGVIPKNNQPGKWRLILDLSPPEGHIVNNGIPKPPFTVQYVSVDTLIDGIMSLGRGTLMAKFDVASEYRNVAIHPDDRPLLGMQWCGQYFVDLLLPFGLHLLFTQFVAWKN